MLLLIKPRQFKPEVHLKYDEIRGISGDDAGAADACGVRDGQKEDVALLLESLPSSWVRLVTSFL